MLSSLFSLYVALNLVSDLNIGKEISIDDLNLVGIVKDSKAPIKNPKYVAPVIYSNSALAIDSESGGILFEKDLHKRLPIASITKLMTVIIVLEENELDEVVTVSGNAASAEGSNMFLVSGEQITVRDLVFGAIIHSANDAAIALAEHNAGSVAKFVEKMNKKAKELNLTNTNFSNPSGLDHPNNYSSAYDVAKMASVAYSFPIVQESALIKEKKVYSVSGKYTHELITTNDLLDSYLNIKGLKTGSTNGAGLCLVAISENSEGKKIITVVLNSPDRFKESKILIDWVFRAYTW